MTSNSKVPSNSMHSMIASYFHARNTMKLLTMLLERQSSSLAMKGLKSKDNVMQIFLQYSIFCMQQAVIASAFYITKGGNPHCAFASRFFHQENT